MPKDKKLKYEIVSFDGVMDIVDLFKEILDEYRIQTIAAGDKNAELKINEYKKRMIDILESEGF